MSFCNKCKANVKNEIVTCDLCDTILCKACSQLTTTEMRALELKERTMRFFCKQCLEKIDSRNFDMGHCDQNQMDIFVSKLECLLELRMKKIYDVVEGLQTQVKVLKEGNIDLVKLLTNLPPVPSFGSKHSSNIGNHPTIPQKSYAGIAQTVTKGNENKALRLAQRGKQNPPVSKINTPSVATPVGDKGNTEGNEHPDNYRELDVDGFIKVQRRPRHRRRANVGTAESNSGPESVGTGLEARGRNVSGNKKIWIFISRVKDHVNERIVQDYISRKSSLASETVTVKCVETKTKFADNKCFLIGVDPAIKEDIYKNEFWPKGIKFDRFDFRRGQHFLDQQRSAELTPI